jgi:hypothetical protein
VKIQFCNTLPSALPLYVDGRLKANLDPGEDITLELHADSKMTFGAGEGFIPARPVQQAAPAALAAPAATLPAQTAFQPEGIPAGKTDKSGRPYKEAKAVDKLDASGQVVQHYRTVTAASRDAGLYWTDIAHAVKYGSEAGGFYWRYSDPVHQQAATSTAKPQPYSQGHKAADADAGTRVLGQRTGFQGGTPIAQYSREGKLMRTFPSQTDAVAMVDGLSISQLGKALKGEIPYAGGSIWKYVATREAIS